MSTVYLAVAQVVFAASAIAWIVLVALRLAFNPTGVDWGFVHEVASHGMLISIGMVVFYLGWYRHKVNLLSELSRLGR